MARSGQPQPSENQVHSIEKSVQALRCRECMRVFVVGCVFVHTHTHTLFKKTKQNKIEGASLCVCNRGKSVFFLWKARARLFKVETRLERTVCLALSMARYKDVDDPCVAPPSTPQSQFHGRWMWNAEAVLSLWFYDVLLIKDYDNPGRGTGLWANSQERHYSQMVLIDELLFTQLSILSLKGNQGSNCAAWDKGLEEARPPGLPPTITQGKQGGEGGRAADVPRRWPRSASQRRRSAGQAEVIYSPAGAF